MTTTYGERVWAGDPSTVVEARARYDEDQATGLIPLAGALYSFRFKKELAEELLSLLPQLLVYARSLLAVRKESEEQADLADVLSTWFEWMSRCGELTRGERVVVLGVAQSVCARGLSIPGSRLHTWCLLRLTYARLLYSEKNIPFTRRYLVGTSSFARAIEDANQRARVYRKLGLLFRLAGMPFSGIYWGVRACLVFGVPMQVRAKSAAALLGIDM